MYQKIPHIIIVQKVLNIKSKFENLHFTHFRQIKKNHL